MLPCLVFEDEHLLAVNKPAGLNTHAPSPYAGEGLYDWLRHREPRWASLALIHRLDKDTSGLILFSKTTLANRSLTDQFTRRAVRKLYLLVTDRRPPQVEWRVRTSLVRAGERYVARPLHAGGGIAETRFKLLEGSEAEEVIGRGLWPMSAEQHSSSSPLYVLAAEPLTGRTHQVRVHAAHRGVPILGDALYGGSPGSRVFLHAALLRVAHPASGEELSFRAPPRFEQNPRLQLRTALLEADGTNAYRLIHGAADVWPGWYVDCLGKYLLSQSDAALAAGQLAKLEELAGTCGVRGVYHKTLFRQVRRAGPGQASPRLVLWGLPSQSHHEHEPATEPSPGTISADTAEPKYPLTPTPLPRREGKRSEPLRDGATRPETSSHAYHSPPARGGIFTPGRFPVRENGVQFELSFEEGYSVGLFLDQRDNRRRLLTGHIAADFPQWTGGAAQSQVLNTFAYTCSFSVCAARAGAHTVSIDLSRKYLDWGKRNFELNGLGPAGHEFLHGEVFDWLRRLGKKGRRFEVILLDPPTFSQSKQSGLFRAERDYPRLLAAAVPLLKPGGVLFASSNAAGWKPEGFVGIVESALRKAGRKILRSHFAPQPPDFPITRAEPGYLKTVWLRVS